MSMIATCFVVRTEKLPQIEAAGSEGFYEVVEGASSKQFAYDWQGWVLGTLDPYLKQKRGVDLADRAYRDFSIKVSMAQEASCVVLKRELSSEELDALAEDSFDRAELREYYEAFYETEAPGIDEAMLAGIDFYRRALSDVGPDEVPFLVVG